MTHEANSVSDIEVYHTTTETPTYLAPVSSLPSLTQEQLISTGSVWSACDQFAQLPRGQLMQQV